MSRSSRVKLSRSENVVTDDKLTRFNRKADSSNVMNQDYAAELLLQMRRIATNELQSSYITPQEMTVHPISPIQGPKERSSKILRVESPCITLPNTPISQNIQREFSSHTTRGTYNIDNTSSARFRTVSIGGINDLEDDSNDRVNKLMINIPCTSGSQGHVSPLLLGYSRASLMGIQYDSNSSTNHVVITPSTSNKKLVFATSRISALQERYSQMIQAVSKDSYDVNIGEEEEQDDQDVEHLPHVKHASREMNHDDRNMVVRSVVNPITKKPISSTTTFTHKYVGETVAPDVKVRDVLRKKFSWKSFPELESYLVNHRKQYLECSNAMNYTKAQKHYNNELTQGLLQLAANEGYVFEEFTFSAVRDRIRCFYKSFVQATKKKKRIHHKGHHSMKHKSITSNNSSQSLTPN
jgi:predicted DNA binding CopG/RHH family protein